MISRRSLLSGLVSTLAAPAIVHAGNLMPVKAIPADPLAVLNGMMNYVLYSDEAADVRWEFGIGRFYPVMRTITREICILHSPLKPPA